MKTTLMISVCILFSNLIWAQDTVNVTNNGKSGTYFVTGLTVKKIEKVSRKVSPVQSSDSLIETVETVTRPVSEIYLPEEARHLTPREKVELAINGEVFIGGEVNSWIVWGLIPKVTHTYLDISGSNKKETGAMKYIIFCCLFALLTIRLQDPRINVLHFWDLSNFWQRFFSWILRCLLVLLIPGIVIGIARFAHGSVGTEFAVLFLLSPVLLAVGFIISFTRLGIVPNWINVVGRIISFSGYVSLLFWVYLYDLDGDNKVTHRLENRILVLPVIIITSVILFSAVIHLFSKTTEKQTQKT